VAAPLLPVQDWFFDTHAQAPQHYNMSVRIELAGGVLPDQLGAAVTAATAPHPVLRSRFSYLGDSRTQYHPAEGAGIPITRVDLSGGAAQAPAELVNREIAVFQATMNLDDGPLARCLLFTAADQATQLVLLAHHLVVDAVSLRTLLEDIEIAYRQLCAGAPVELEPAGTSFGQWARRLRDEVRAGAFIAERDYWLAVTGPRPRVDVDGPDTVASEAELVVALDESKTGRLLRATPARYRATVEEILLTALGSALTEFGAEPDFLVDVESHGRHQVFEGVELSRTVGWLTTVFPLRLAGNAEGDHRARVRSAAQQLRAVPRHGLGYGALRYLAADRELAESAQAPVLFNYLGRFDDLDNGESGLFRTVRPAPNQRGNRGDRPYLLDLTAEVTGGRLRFSVRYSTRVHDERTVAEFAQRFLDELGHIIDSSRTEGKS
jgi:non-ribosomal peptide synthase protein (TIGR01720 family)